MNAIVAAADRNLIGSFRKLAEHQPDGHARSFGGVFAFRTGIPASFFNGCIVTGQGAADDVDAAVLWLNSARVPNLLWIREELMNELRVATAGREMEPWLLPQMVLEPVTKSPAPSTGVSVEPVDDAETFAAFHGAFVEAGTPLEMIERIAPASFTSDPDVRMFLARLDGRPVGTSIAIRTGDVSGVYAVGTIDAARRRGVGTAATWAAVEAGRAWGCERIVLQSSEMGFALYEAMGFRTVVRYALFGSGRPSASSAT